MKKAVSLILILLIIVSNFAAPLEVYAQEASSSAAAPTASASAAPAATDHAFDSEIAALKKEALTQNAINSLTNGYGSFSSIQKKLPTKIRALKKKTFKLSEKIPVTVENDDASQVTVEVFGFDGEKVAADVEVVSSVAPAMLLVEPPRHFKPGRYRLKITDSEGKVTTQDFTWGVLAINTNKSIYQPNEVAKIEMAVLDETGNMVCDAKVTLAITDPQGNVTNHSTETNSIKVGENCPKKIYTMEPDFEAKYSVVNGEGTYQMTLTATTKNGTYTITDAFQAKEDVPFDVERETNTRIFPPLRYPVLFSIKANQDFSGEVSEIVPESFDIGTIENMPEFAITTRHAKDEPNTHGFHLDLPFSGNFAMSQGFGVEETDSLMAAKYEKYGLIGHDGVDYAVPMNTPVLAADDGIVVRAAEKGDYGTTIIVQHPWGRSYYGHLSKMEKQVGDTVKRGDEIGLSGNTGLSTGPHLHFGIKMQINDDKNGYYGKVNPVKYYATGDSIVDGNVAGIATSSAILRNDAGDGVKILTWNVDVKKGDTIKLGYTYLAPNISPQFYTVGPLEFISAPVTTSENTETPVASDSGQISNNNVTLLQPNLGGQLIFKEARTWQIAVDADGSGTNSVSPSSEATSTSQTFTFTFTPTENMDSGSIQIVVPVQSSDPDQGVDDNWPTPSGVTTAVGNNNAVVGTVFSAVDSATGWTEEGGTDACVTGPTADTTDKIEGTASVTCNNDTSGAAPDNNDGIAFSFTSADWSSYTNIGFWARSEDGMVAGNLSMMTSTVGGDCTTTNDIQETNLSALTANTWTYQNIALSGTRTDVETFCILAGSNSAVDNDQYWIDEILLGPGIPTFSGSGPYNINIRLLAATSGDTVTVSYGPVTTPLYAGTYTFTTKSATRVDGTLTNISVDGSSPTIQLCDGVCAPAGPTNDQLMRHGAWFNAGAEQPFEF